MITRLVRWPNGMLSIVTAEDEKDMARQLMKEQVCTDEEMDSPTASSSTCQEGSAFISASMTRRTSCSRDVVRIRCRPSTVSTRASNR